MTLPLVWGWEVAEDAARLYAGLWFRELRSVKVRCNNKMGVVFIQFKCIVLSTWFGPLGSGSYRSDKVVKGFKELENPIRNVW